MTNNDVLRRLRYTFDLKDSTVVEIFALADATVTEAQVIAWLKKDEDKDFAALKDTDLALFLNGFINLKRGKRDGEPAAPEKSLNNNMVFQKLRIALNLKAEDIVDILQRVDFSLSKHELSSFFRKPDNKHYRECKDQILRNFLLGLQSQFRPNDSNTEA